MLNEEFFIFYLHANFAVSRGVEFARHVTLAENQGSGNFQPSKTAPHLELTTRIASPVR